MAICRAIYRLLGGLFPRGDTYVRVLHFVETDDFSSESLCEILRDGVFGLFGWVFFFHFCKFH